MNKTSIEWTDYTWNPVTGCDKISAGCRSCYAETLANRFWGDRKFTNVQMHEDRLNEPSKNLTKWAGKKVFVCSMSDLFHEDVTFDFIDHVFLSMCYYVINRHEVVFQILTKRPERALQFYKERRPGWMNGLPKDGYGSNIWIGVSCENQEQSDKRIPLLLQIPAAVRFLSCEPLIGPIDLTAFLPSPHGEGPGVRWVIAGGESGGKLARPMHPDWVRSLRDQCAAANVPFFFKQWGEWRPGSEYGEGTISLNPDKKHHLFNDLTGMYRVGKSKSGNLLDGKQHLNFPAIKSNV